MKIVTVHRGARDSYQVARALSEAGMLEALVTDVYWPADRRWAQSFERIAPRSLPEMLRLRHAEGVAAEDVVSCWPAGLYALVMNKVRSISFERQREAVRWCDRLLGRRAGQLATSRSAALLSYSYYGHSAFSNYEGHQPRILFQLHPHPTSVRNILLRERTLWPECASSLDREWELALPEQDFSRLVQEPAMAEYCLAASSFTKQTLIENGVPAERVDVVPYGIDLARFTPKAAIPPGHRPLRLLFVGTLAQRKGVKYLLEALELLPAGSVELTFCGRAVDDLELFQNSRVPIRLRPSISAEELLEAYRYADVFVFPSLAEGFAHVLLEAMASGLPIISTTSTAAPDLIRHGEEGFILPPGDAVELAKHIEHFLLKPERIQSMGEAARRRAEYFTWQRFRQHLGAVVGRILQHSTDCQERELCLSS